MKLIKWMSVALLITLLTGCLTGGVNPRPTAQSNAVRPATLEQVADCKYLGPVNSYAGPVYQGLKGAQNVARNKVVGFGGNTIVIQSSAIDPDGTGHVVADAYSCLK